MQQDLVSALIVYGAAGLYISALVIGYLKRWPLRAGLVMFVASAMPYLWQLFGERAQLLSYGASVALTMPLALIVIAWGVILAATRGYRRMRNGGQIL